MFGTGVRNISMSQPGSEHWSLTKSLAFLAATFAIVFATFMPVAVAASPSLGAPVVLCGGGELRVIHLDEEGQPVEDHSTPSLTCAMALLSGLAAVPVPELQPHTVPVGFERNAPLYSAANYRQPPVRGPPLRPHSTAPPIA